jgi:NhaP-type Na+/H+ or K+/H+ antiporter
VAYLTGFSVATLALTFAGRALMQKTDNRFSRALGGVVAATGALLAAALRKQLENKVKTKSCVGLPRSFFYCIKLWFFAKGQTSSTEMF